MFKYPVRVEVPNHSMCVRLARPSGAQEAQSGLAGSGSSLESIPTTSAPEVVPHGSWASAGMRRRVFGWLCLPGSQ